MGWLAAGGDPSEEKQDLEEQVFGKLDLDCDGALHEPVALAPGRWRLPDVHPQAVAFVEGLEAGWRLAERAADVSLLGELGATAGSERGSDFTDDDELDIGGSRFAGVRVERNLAMPRARHVVEKKVQDEEYTAVKRGAALVGNGDDGKELDEGLSRAPVGECSERQALVAKLRETWLRDYGGTGDDLEAALKSQVEDPPVHVLRTTLGILERRALS